MKRLQEIEFETDCKKLTTALRRFQKKYPEVYNVWGEFLKWMIETGQEKDDGRESAGYFARAIEDDGHYYFCLIFYNEQQVFEV